MHPIPAAQADVQPSGARPSGLLRSGGAPSYRPDIDGLRCVAVMLVLVFHFDLFGVGKAGFMGVDVFFVISGFLISTIVWRQLESGAFSLGAFYLRRFRRLAPAFVVTQIATLAFAYLFLLPNETIDLANQSLFAALYVINVYLWKSINYFGLAADTVPLLHCWSLAVEEQFYLVYPVLLLLVYRFARRHLLAVLVGVALVSFALNLALVTSRPTAAFYLLPPRAWELALGALIPFAQPLFSRSGNLRDAAAAGGVALLVTALVTFSAATPFPGAFALLPTLGAALLILAGGSAGSWLSPVLSRPGLVYVGKISYSLYLVHWPVRVFAELLLLDYSLAWRWGLLALSFGLAVLLYHVVEEPVRRGAVLRTTRAFVLSYAGAFFVVVGIAGSALLGQGWRQRFSDRALKVADYHMDQNHAARHCEYNGAEWSSAAACLLGDPAAKRSWLVVGDSHAWALGSSFSRYFGQQGVSGQLVFNHGCMPVLGLGPKTCQQFASAIVEDLGRHSEIEHVVLVAIWRQVFEQESLPGANGVRYSGAERHLAFKRQLRETLNQLTAQGKAVYVWEPLPSALKPVPRTLAQNQISRWPLEVGAKRADFEREFAFLREALSENKDLIRGTLVPADALCRAERCLVEFDGAPLYYDNNHPANSQTLFYSRIIESGLGKLH